MVESLRLARAGQIGWSPLIDVEDAMIAPTLDARARLYPGHPRRPARPSHRPQTIATQRVGRNRRPSLKKQRQRLFHQIPQRQFPVVIQTTRGHVTVEVDHDMSFVIVTGTASPIPADRGRHAPEGLRCCPGFAEPGNRCTEGFVGTGQTDRRWRADPAAWSRSIARTT